jgi:hypothetical protein
MVHPQHRAGRRRCTIDRQLEEPGCSSIDEQAPGLQHGGTPDPTVPVERDRPQGPIQTGTVHRFRPQQQAEAGAGSSQAAAPSAPSRGHPNRARSPSRAGQREVDGRVRHDAWYAPLSMAKAKRRKLRARKSKANHGRRPNAGRGK